MLARTLKTAVAISRTIADREANAAALAREIEADRVALSDAMDDGPAYEKAFGAIAAKESRLTAVTASLRPLQADLTTARQRESAAQDQADLADFERRKRKASPARRAQYERLTSALRALAQEMDTERTEAETLRHRGLSAQADVSHNVLNFLHLPSWKGGEAEIYRPRGADGFALQQAFLGRRP